MKPVAGRPCSSPSQPLLDEPNPRQDVPAGLAGSKRTSAQAGLQGELAEQSKRQLASHHGVGANRASLQQRQLLDQLNAKPASAALVDTKSKGAPTHWQAPSPTGAAAPNAVPGVALQLTQQLPVEQHLASDADLEWALQLAGWNAEQSEPAPPASMAAGGAFADETNPFAQQVLIDLELESEFEANEVLYFLERPLSADEEQLLQCWLADEELGSPVAAQDAQGLGSQAKPPAASTTDARAIANQLQHLGHSQEPADCTQPRSCFEALGSQSLSVEEPSQISERAPSPQSLTEQGPELLESLPDVARSDIAKVAQSRNGHLSLQALKLLGKDLKDAPLRLHDQQLINVARRGGAPALRALYSLGPQLIDHPYRLPAEQIVAIASNIGGAQALAEVKDRLLELGQEPYNLQPGTLVAIASHNGGAQALAAVRRHLPALVNGPLVGLGNDTYRFTRSQVVDIARHEGGAKALATVMGHLPVLVDEPFNLSTDQIVAITRHKGGAQALEAVIEHLPVLVNEPYDLKADQVVAMARHEGSAEVLALVRKHLLDLVEKPHNRSREYVVRIASCQRGKKRLEELIGSKTAR